MSEKSYMLFYEMKRHVKETDHGAYAVELSDTDRNGRNVGSGVARFTCLNCVVGDPDKFIELRRGEREEDEKYPTVTHTHRASESCSVNCPGNKDRNLPSAIHHFSSATGYWDGDKFVEKVDGE